MVFFHWFWTSEFCWILLRALVSSCSLNGLTRMNERTIGWTKDRTEGSDWMKEPMNKRTNESTKVRTNERNKVNEWTNQWKNERTNERGILYRRNCVKWMNGVSRYLSFFYEKLNGDIAITLSKIVHLKLFRSFLN